MLHVCCDGWRASELFSGTTSAREECTTQRSPAPVLLLPLLGGCVLMSVLQCWACLVCWRVTPCMLLWTPSGAGQHSRGSACCHTSRQVGVQAHTHVFIVVLFQVSLVPGSQPLFEIYAQP